MNCFQHREEAAVGVCRNCGKAVCPACAREVTSGIVCSQACEDEHTLMREMNQRALKLYGIGVPQKGLPDTVIVPLLMGLGFVLGAVLMGLTIPDPAPMVMFFLLMASVGLLGAFIAYRKFRENGLNV